MDWYEVSVKYENCTSSGLVETINESYLVDAMSFSEAEQRVIKEEFSYSQLPYEVKACCKRKYRDIVTSSSACEGLSQFFKASLKIITFDEKSGKGKLSPVRILVEASDFDHAVANLKNFVDKGMVNYEIEGLTKTKIVEVLYYDSNKNKE